MIDAQVLKTQLLSYLVKNNIKVNRLNPNKEMRRTEHAFLCGAQVAGELPPAVTICMLSGRSILTL